MATKKTEEERAPTCSACRRPARIFISHGVMGAGDDAQPFVQSQPIPCEYCADTNGLRGWAEAIKYLLEARDDR